MKKLLCILLMLSMLTSLFTITPLNVAAATRNLYTSIIVNIDHNDAGNGSKTVNPGNPEHANGVGGQGILLDSRNADTTASSRRRMAFMTFDFSAYKADLLADRLEGLSLSLTPNSDGFGSATRFLVYLLSSELAMEVENIEHYGYAKNVGFTTYTENQIWHNNSMTSLVPSSSGDIMPQIKEYFNAPGNENITTIGFKIFLGNSGTSSIIGSHCPDEMLRPQLLVETISELDIVNMAGAELQNTLPKITTSDITLPTYIPSPTACDPATTIIWSSNNPTYISDSGVVTRPSFYDGSKKVTLTASITNGGMSKDFFYEITILKNGDFIATGELSSPTLMRISFNISAPAPETGGYTLKIPAACMEPAKEYVLYADDANKTEIRRFLPDIDNEYTSITVSNDVNQTNVAFLLESITEPFEGSAAVFILEAIDSAVQSIVNTVDSIDLGDLSAVTQNLSLPTEVNGLSLSWRSSNRSYLSETGRVDRPFANEGDVIVSLTVTYDDGVFTYSRTFLVTILKQEGGGSSFPELHDPMHMTDQTFFGQWSTLTNRWAVTPILQYDAYPELNTVLNFVKQGNYPKAKEALLTYYRGRNEKITWKLTNASPTDTTNFLRTEMINEKIYSFLEGGDVVGITEVGSDWGWHTVDLRLGAVKGSVVLIDSNMDGYSMAEVYSRRNTAPASQHGQTVPYLEVIENGTQRFLPAIQDTFISAGSNRDTNYSTSQMLYVREQADFSNSARPLPVSSDTRRAYLRFDTPSLIGDVTSMKLHFYGRSNSSRQKIFVFSLPQENTFTEKDLTWVWKAANVRHFTNIFNNKQTGWMFNMDPSANNTGAPPNSGGLATSGSEYASSDYRTWNTTYEWINYNTRLYPIEWMISRYRLTNNELYAYNALDFLMSLYSQSGHRGNYWGANYPRDLEGAWRTEYLCHAFFGTLNSDVITPEVLTAQLKYVYGHLERFLVSPASSAQNQNSAARIGALRMQAYFPELKTPAHWTAAKVRLHEMYMLGFPSLSLPAFTSSDGSYTEATTGYMDGTVRELVQCLDMLRAYDGLDDTYYKMFMDQYYNIMEYMLNVTFPYGMTPGWGDAGRGNLKGFLAQMIDIIDVPQVRYYTSGGAQGEIAPYTSKLYEDNATVWMKDGWMSNSFGAFINAFRGGSHSHSDALALDVSAYGVPLLVDAGNSSYSPSDSMVRTVQKSLSHNLVEIANYNRRYSSNSADNGDQESATQDPQRISLAANKLFDFVVAGSGPGPMTRPDGTNKPGSGAIYNGYDTNRKVLFLHNKYWIVSDYIIPDNNTPNTYRQAWHPNANENGERGLPEDIDYKWAEQMYPSLTEIPTPINKLTIDTNSKVTRSHLQGSNIKIVPADPEKLDARKVQYYQATPRFGAVYANFVNYVQENVVGPVTYDTVLYPEKANDDTHVAVYRIKLADTPTITATALKIDIGSNTGYYYTSNEETPTERVFGNYLTNGEMAYVETNINDQVTMAALTNASNLKRGNIELVSIDQPIRDLAIQWAASTLHLYTEDGTLPSTGIKIYSETPIATVNLNGSQVNATYENKIVTTSGQPYSQSSAGTSNSIGVGSPGGMGNSGGNGNASNPVVGSVSSKPAESNTADNNIAGNNQQDTNESSNEAILPDMFTDISEHWAKEEIENMYEIGFVKGNGDGTFLPDTDITRAEFLSILVRVLSIETADNSEVIFSDVALDDWFAADVESAYRAGLVSGYGDGNFYPYNQISRQEMATMLINACKYLGIEPNGNTDNTYEDSYEIEDWAEQAVAAATALGLVQGVGDNRFAPLDNVTRAQAVVVASRLLKFTAPPDNADE